MQLYAACIYYKKSVVSQFIDCGYVYVQFFLLTDFVDVIFAYVIDYNKITKNYKNILAKSFI